LQLHQAVQALEGLFITFLVVLVKDRLQIASQLIF